MPTTYTNGLKLPDLGSIDWYSSYKNNIDILDPIVGAVSSKAADDQVVHKAGAETITGDKTFTGATATHNITPEADGTYSFGSSSYQWASVYGQTYYYNGTQWGLDKENHWSSNQYVEHNSTPKVLLKDLRNDRTYSVTDKYGGIMRWECVDKDNAPLSRISTQLRNDKAVLLQFAIYNENSSGAEFDRTLRFVTNTSGESGQTSFYPEQSDVVNLGISGNKWKTLNGINPGALSLPGNAADRIDISGSLTNLDGTSNSYTPPVPGWLCIRVNGTAGNYIYIQQGSGGLFTRVDADGASSHIYLIMPVLSGIVVTIQIVAQSGLIARLYPCLGNV